MEGWNFEKDGFFKVRDTVALSYFDMTSSTDNIYTLDSMSQQFFIAFLETYAQPWLAPLATKIAFKKVAFQFDFNIDKYLQYFLSNGYKFICIEVELEVLY
jgi:hypothetical protein